MFQFILLFILIAIALIAIWWLLSATDKVFFKNFKLGSVITRFLKVLLRPSRNFALLFLLFLILSIVYGVCYKTLTDPLFFGYMLLIGITSFLVRRLVLFIAKKIKKESKSKSIANIIAIIFFVALVLVLSYYF